ncbi:hypothetical protein [Streptomyces sp. NBC_00102]|uniref:hypothetical protein n=1 Tax=Streptomyces sp. NBC_00102 TaxID=2975652 RepID=UPI0022553E47|nr:hypothetical protein [Streptomyces sp. NBC_00102]MCX5397689.1 hypothetical protein [Streptomyces sp. NBC_00102]
MQPHGSYDTKTFTACFNGSTSNGEWAELGSGMKGVYFQIMKIGGSTFGPRLTVNSASVDTAKADG